MTGRAETILEEARRRAAEHDQRMATDPAYREQYLADRAAREAEEQALVQRRWRDDRWRRTVPARFVDAHVGQLDGHLAHAATWDGRENVILLGPVGVGKTHTALAVARTAHDRGAAVTFTSTARFLDDIRAEMDNGDGTAIAMRRAIDVDVLVLDDLGVERPTDWSRERLDVLIDGRWSEGRPTIVTSNASPDVLRAAVGPRAWSRLDDGALLVRAPGNDRRRTTTPPHTGDNR